MRAALLKGCVLQGVPVNLPGQEAWSASLQYQAQVLGMAVQADGVFQLHVPGLQSIACDAGVWPNGEGQGSEFLLQAACGLMSVHGRSSGTMQPLGVNYLSALYASVWLQGALAAALGQARGLPIRSVSSPWVASGLLALGQYLAGATVDEHAEVLLPACASAVNRPPFVSADGVVFELEALDAKPWRALWSELGVPLDVAGKSWTAFLMRYAKATSPMDSVLMDTLLALPYADIACACARHGVAICPVRSVDEWQQEPSAQALLKHGPWLMSLIQGLEFPPVLGNKPSSDLPLSGFTVVESCRRIQGPLAGHMLALLGAKVIRIEPPGGDPLRGMPPLAGDVSARFDALNGLKQVIEIDIKSPAGQAQVCALVREADVFLHNWAPGKAAELNLDAGDLHAVNPALVYAYAGGWGPNSQHGLPGTDFMVQAYSGLAREIAQACGTRGGSLFTVLDVLGGVMASQGVVSALLARQLKGQGVSVYSSLEGAAALLCATRDTAPKVNRTQWLCETQQGVLAVDVLNDAMSLNLAKCLNVDVGAEPCAFELAVRAALMENTAQYWFEHLQARDIACAVAVDDLSGLPWMPGVSGALLLGSYARVISSWRFA
jgi:CoA:oxalate CoA-transferase